MGRFGRSLLPMKRHLFGIAASVPLAWPWPRWRPSRRRRRRRRLLPDVTFTKDIAPILQRSCQQCHHPDGGAPMPLDHLRRGAAVGARDQDADRPRAARRRDAAVVRREEHRHPEVQGRSVAERRGDREDREVGRQRRAARQSGRHADAARLRQRRQVDARRAGSRSCKSPEVVVPGGRSRQVGLARHWCRPASPRIATSRRSKCARSTTSRRAARPRRSAAATCSTT